MQRFLERNNCDFDDAFSTAKADYVSKKSNKPFVLKVLDNRKLHFQELKREIAIERRQTMQSLFEALPIQHGRAKYCFSRKKTVLNFVICLPILGVTLETQASLSEIQKNSCTNVACTEHTETHTVFLFDCFEPHEQIQI